MTRPNLDSDRGQSGLPGRAASRRLAVRCGGLALIVVAAGMVLAVKAASSADGRPGCSSPTACWPRLGAGRRRSGSCARAITAPSGGRTLRAHGRHPRRQGPHLHQPLRPPRLGAWRGRRSAARGTPPTDMLAWAGLDQRPDQELGPARPRRRRFRDRPEVVLHAQGGEGAAALSGGQRRRVRARHLQGPRDHAPRSAPADRRLPDRLASRCGRTPATSTSAANTCSSASAWRRRSSRPTRPS